MLADFFYPYVSCLHGAAYNVMQTLEGLGISHSNFVIRNEAGQIVDGYWSPAEAVYAPLGGLIVFTIISVILVLCAAYVLFRTKGVVVALLLIFLPGFLNLVHIWPELNYMPERYVIGGKGVVGDIVGYLPILFLALLFGWALTVIVYSSFLFNEKFRNFYDHIWYCSAIFAGVFFVADSGANLDKARLSEENKISSQASAYLSRQLKDYRDYCESKGIETISSCVWASDVQQLLTNYTYYDEKIYSSLGPEKSEDIYSPFSKKINPEVVIAMRKEIQEYNDLICPVTIISETSSKHARPSFRCQMVPAQFCRVFPDEPSGIVDRYILARTVALGSECIVPMLVKSREIQESLIDKISVVDGSMHLRWLYFIFLAFLAGGKIANSTTKLFGVDTSKINDRKRLVILLKTIFSLSLKILYFSFKFSSYFIKNIFYLMLSGFQYFKNLNRNRIV